jgi:hypothetical protein
MRFQLTGFASWRESYFRANPDVLAYTDLCLEEMRRCFATYRTCAVTVDTPLLTVSFIGYRREYDVVEEIERVGMKRRLK